ncbi:MAG: complex I NDUFA9 subunit family protein [Proteobacteria bacterium]|nr:complex I NDUFA9 subunit family protein [Pseudomonadota bacterium]MCZ6483727.1 complex I NDUFA9 subunit family protein [Alphaproteobacteria bacterium]MCZ6743310.1 complex I NDUFA9 subunit family protein [Alphaproteobacteria bacterium]
MTPSMVTVFGGSGFLGRHLVQRLAATGARVTVAVRNPESALFLKPMGDVGQITPVGADVRDGPAVAAAVQGADWVVNLVGVLYETRRQSFSAIHAQGAERIAKAAKAAGAKRLVHVSAIGANRHSSAAYARSKAAGEAAVAAAYPAATILRPSIIFGPEDDFFNRFAAMARVSVALPLFGGGETRFQPVYVGDVAAAVVKALTDEGTAGTTYELGGPRVYSFRQLMTLMLAEIGRKRILLPLPFFVADAMGAVLQSLPLPFGMAPPLTGDQAKLLRYDNVVSGDAPGLADLGIAPTACEIILPTYLDRFRRHGRFEASPGG